MHVLFVVSQLVTLVYGRNLDINSQVIKFRFDQKFERFNAEQVRHVSEIKTRISALAS